MVFENVWDPCAKILTSVIGNENHRYRF